MSETESRVFLTQVLACAGETGALLLARDWSDTALGPLASWPQSLQTALSMVCQSSTPMSLSWGPSWLQLYNDAYRELLPAGAHPVAFGAPASINEASDWPRLRTAFERVRAEGRALPFA